MTLEDIDELTPPERQLFAKVGKAKFGDDWVGIERLTSRERWLYDRYVKGTRRGGGSSILPGHITFVPADGGRTWAERPHGPKLLAEVEDASDRIDWLITKYTWVDEWLDDNDFGDVVDLDALQQALINSGLIAEDALPMPAAPKEPDTLPEPDQSVGTEPTPLSSPNRDEKMPNGRRLSEPSVTCG